MAFEQAAVVVQHGVLDPVEQDFAIVRREAQERCERCVQVPRLAGGELKRAPDDAALNVLEACIGQFRPARWLIELERQFVVVCAHARSVPGELPHFDLLHLTEELEELLGHHVDVVSTGGLKDRDDKILAEAVDP